jgi:hypothetical protein
MTITIRIALAATLLPAVSHASPITVGVGLGRIQSDYAYDDDAKDTKQLFGRVGFTPRLALQLELQKIENDGFDIRSGTALLVVELGNTGGHLVPLLVAGLGIDRASNDYYETSGSHKEGGLGLEYRADGGLTIGADVRLGGRSVDEQRYPVAYEDEPIYFTPGGIMAEGEYRSARLYAAIRF